MNKTITVVVVVEGQTENAFVKEVLAPYWGQRGIFVEAPVYRTQVDMRSGRVYKGGDIRFSRLEKQLRVFLKRRKDTIVASFVDYYGIREWPGLDRITRGQTPRDIALTLCDAAKRELALKYPENDVLNRFFPFFAIHEFEALLFSDANVLSTSLDIPLAIIEKTLNDCGSPEEIDNSPQTAPSKRLDAWTNGFYRKTAKGITIAQDIGIDKMRRACPNFDFWLKSIETIQTKE
ncbi:MAG: DUF4276 family protein [Victivallales bacterium]|nr:DUF4276 family protein [Victivallales bacterium]